MTLLRGPSFAAALLSLAVAASPTLGAGLPPSTPAPALTPAWTPATLFSRGLRPVVPGAPPAGIASLSASECETCHVREAAEWRESLHRKSWTQPLFQQAYAIEPMAECRNCHQPLTAGKRPGPAVAALQDEGVNCAACHVRAGRILGTTVSGRAPHKSSAAPALGTADFCGGCHQFPFPDRRGDGKIHHTDEPMQDTLEEWRSVTQAGQAGRTCQGCHMPPVKDPSGRSHRSHRFLGGYDPGLLNQAITVAATLGRGGIGAGAGEARLRVTLSARDVGHMVPTGDLYRSLVVEAEATDAAGHPLPGVAPQRQALQRSFMSVVESDETGHLRVRRRQSDDDRLVPGQPQTLEFRFPLSARPGPAAARYRLSLHRLPPGTPENNKKNDNQKNTGATMTLVTEGLVSFSPGETS